LKVLLLGFVASLGASLAPVLTRPLYTEGLNAFQGLVLISFFGALSLSLLAFHPEFFKSPKSVLRRWKSLLFIGLVFQAAPACLLHYGLMSLPAMFVVMLKRLQPILILLIVFLIQRKSVSLISVVASVVSVAGVCLLIVSGEGFGLQGVEENWTALLSVMLAVLLWALFFVFVKQVGEGVSPEWINFFILLCLIVVNLPLSFVLNPWPEGIFQNHQLMLLTLINGAFCFAFGLTAVNYCLKLLDPVVMSLLMLLGPLVAAAGAHFLLNETLNQIQISGLITSLVGLSLLPAEKLFKKRSN